MNNILLDLEWIVLLVVYVLLISVNIFGVILYRKAFYKMKKTIMIKSVYYLLISLLIENVYFLGVVIASSNYFYFLSSPLMWSIPKFILLCSIVFFIYASLTPTKFLKKR